MDGPQTGMYCMYVLFFEMYDKKSHNSAVFTRYECVSI